MVTINWFMAIGMVFLGSIFIIGVFRFIAMIEALMEGFRLSLKYGPIESMRRLDAVGDEWEEFRISILNKYDIHIKW